MPNSKEIEPNKLSPMAALYLKHYITIFNVCSPSLQRRMRDAVDSETEPPTDVKSLISKIAANAEAEYDELTKPKQLPAPKTKTKIPVE